MKIILSPISHAGPPPDTVLARDGGTLIVNGVPHDLAALLAEKQADTTDEWEPPAGIHSIAEGPDGIEVRVAYPIGPDASEAQRFPAPIIDPADGPVALPGAQEETV